MLKKITFISTFLLFYVFTVFSQSQPTVIWSEDFDSLTWDQYGLGEGPEGWILFDNTGNGFNWKWSLEGPRGRYTSPNGQQLGDSSFVPADPIQSSTYENGFMMLEADYFNTDEFGEQVFPLIEMDAFVQTPAIDFSDQVGAVLKLQQSFRFSGYTNTTQISVMISTDFDPDDIDSGTWTEYSLKGNISSGQYSDDPDIVELNISSKVAGEPEVYIRFYMGNTAQYFWMIDDIEIIEPYNNDLKINRFWADYVEEPDETPGLDSLKNWNGGYVTIPEKMVQEFVSFRAAISSMGIETQSNTKLNVNITRDGTEVYNEDSDPTSIDFFSEALLKVSAEFTPSGMGHYQVSATVSSEDFDDYMPDNYALYEFEVGDTVYSRSTSDPLNYSFISTSMLGGGADGNNLCVMYEVPEFDGLIDFGSVTTYIHPFFDTATIEYGNASMIARVYAFNESTNTFEITPLRSSDSYQLQVEDIGNFVTLPLIDEGLGTIQPGKYAVGFEFYLADSYRHFLLGNDISVFQPGNTAFAFIGSQWEAVEVNPVIKLNIKTITSVDEFASPAFNVSQNYPNPFSGNTEITYTLPYRSDVKLELFDITGKRVFLKEYGHQKAGRNTILFKADAFKSGIYMYRLSSGSDSETRRMVISH